jgi:hypothetical protein
MPELSENDMRWFAARLSIAVEDVRRSGGMSVNEMKQALRAIPGVEGLTVGYAASGNQVLTIAGRTVEVAPTASNDDIVAAFAATPLSAITVPIATPMPPPIAFTTPKSTGTTSMSITGAAPATLSVKDLIANSRALVQSAHDKLTVNAAKVAQAAAALDGLGDSLGKEGDDLMAMIGQFTNGAPTG